LIRDDAQQQANKLLNGIKVVWLSGKMNNECLYQGRDYSIYNRRGFAPAAHPRDCLSSGCWTACSPYPRIRRSLMRITEYVRYLQLPVAHPRDCLSSGCWTACSPQIHMNTRLYFDVIGHSQNYWCFIEKEWRKAKVKEGYFKVLIHKRRLAEIQSEKAVRLANIENVKVIILFMLLFNIIMVVIWDYTDPRSGKPNKCSGRNSQGNCWWF
jgi:hypothetical protein